jgi:hypothetical protein
MPRTLVMERPLQDEQADILEVDEDGRASLPLSL